MKSRRTFLKNTTLAAGVAAAVPSFSFNIWKKMPLPEGPIVGHGDYRYKIDKNWAKISRVQTPLLNCHEMVMDQNGHLIMLGDHTSNNILIFDKSGGIIDSWGTQYPGGHGLTLANEGGEDYLFIVDCGWYLNRKGEWKKQ
ncbi:MAG: twin-arginine translocation signal domain-containing protein, partial [Bacteroidota bacterium]